MVDIANIIGKQSGYEELLMPSGELKPGVQIIDKQSGDVVAEGERFPSRNLQPGDAGFLDDSFSGDYCEVRDIILLETRHSIAKAVLKMDYVGKRASPTVRLIPRTFDGGLYSDCPDTHQDTGWGLQVRLRRTP